MRGDTDDLRTSAVFNHFARPSLRRYVLRRLEHATVGLRTDFDDCCGDRSRLPFVGLAGKAYAGDYADNGQKETTEYKQQLNRNRLTADKKQGLLNPCFLV